MNINMLKFSSESEARFGVKMSLPVENRRSTAALDGYIVWPRKPESWKSPSTASTSSLAQLHEKLAALPPFSYDKELVSVCALPQLSNVTEVSETEDNHTVSTSVTTVKLRPYGVCQNRFGKPIKKPSQSTSEDSQERKAKILSPVNNEDENSISCLLLATLGSADDSVISDTIERLPKDIPCNTDNIVDLLVQEALQNNTDKETNKQNANNTYNNNETKNIQQNNFFQVDKPLQNLFTNEKEFNINNIPAIDESSNEIVDNTPINYVNCRRSKRIIERNQSKSNAESSKVIDYIKQNHSVQDVEDFFSKHFSENQNGELVISPTLAKKINETSSECSEDFECCLTTHNYMVQDINLDPLVIPNLDIVECLKEMVDKVCQDFDKCTKYLDMQQNIEIANDPTHEMNPQESVATDKSESHESQKVISKEENPNKAVKLQYTKKKSLSYKRIPKTNVHVDNKQLLLSPIIEKESVMDESVTENLERPAISAQETESHAIQRKRKLYSPKNELSHKKTVVHITESTEEDTTTNSDLKNLFQSTSKPESKPKSISTFYKELEKERKKRVRKPRTSRTSKVNTKTAESPRTQKINQIFDSLKDVNNSEPVKLIDKNIPKQNLAVYNYTSDSDEEDVKKKSNSNTGLEKLTIPPAGIVKAAKKTRERRPNKKNTATNKKINVTNETKKQNTKQRPKLTTTKRELTKTQNDTVAEIVEQKLSLEDERMRKGTPEVLNTSVVSEIPNDEGKPTDKEPDPILIAVPQMEYISEGKVEENRPIIKTRKNLSLKRNKDKTQDIDSDVSNERTRSPLPGLLVETVLVVDDDINNLKSSNMLQKFKDIYQGKVVECDGNTTQNLLSDIEQINDISVNLNITEELNQQIDKGSHDTSKILNEDAKEKSNTKNNSKNLEIRRVKRERCTAKPSENDDLKVINLTATEIGSEKSMATQGNTHSPITAHGDFNENPPNSTLLKENIEPRLVEEENYSNSLKDFFMKLNTELYESDCDITSDVKGSSNGNRANAGHFRLENDGSDGNKTNDDRSTSNSRSGKWPAVVITRLSTKDFDLASGSESSRNIKTKLNRENIIVSADKEKNTVQKKDATIEESHETPTKNFSFLKSVRKTMISPIRLCENFELKNNEALNSPQSEKEDCLKRVRSILTDKKQKDVIKNRSKKTISRNNKCRTTSNESLSVKDTASPKGSDTSKRKLSPVLGSSKRSKIEVTEFNNNVGDFTDIESGPSLRSVDDWFKSKKPTCTADSIKFTIKENTKNLLEKLDTTLVEIHHNTSKRFVNMFVNAQKDIKKLKEKRREMYRQTASDIMSEVVKIMDAKFADLDKRSQSMDEEFMCTLKERSREVLREDSKVKGVMVSLLREDVQAVIDHMS